MSVTIREIAEEAKVSIATVSRVVNNADHPINPKTRERVLKVIKDLNYASNIYGKGLAGQSNVIGLCIGAPLSVDPGFALSVARFIDGMKPVVRARGYHVFLEVDVTSADSDAGHQFFAGVPLAGVVILAPRKGNPMIPQLRKRQIPFVVAGSSDYKDSHFVDGNQVLAGELAVAHLVALGRKRIGCLGGPEEFSASRDMEYGFRQGLKKHNLRSRRNWFRRPEWTLESGRKEALMMLKASPRPEAVYAFTDFLALGALQAAQELELRVPEDLAIIGYDDYPMASMVHPKLTTFRHPDDAVAARAAEVLIDLLASKNQPNGLVQEFIEPKLIVRESCGAPASMRSNHLA